MLSIHEHDTLEEASSDLLSFVLDPHNWLAQGRDGNAHETQPQNDAYQRRVGKLRVCASVDVQANLNTQLRVSFRAPGLSPLKAADHLETFLKPRLPLLPNTEWQVELDEKSWIHFFRPYTLDKLQA